MRIYICLVRVKGAKTCWSVDLERNSFQSVIFKLQNNTKYGKERLGFHRASHSWLNNVQNGFNQTTIVVATVTHSLSMPCWHCVCNNLIWKAPDPKHEIMNNNRLQKSELIKLWLNLIRLGVLFLINKWNILNRVKQWWWTWQNSVSSLFQWLITWRF